MLDDANRSQGHPQPVKPNGSGRRAGVRLPERAQVLVRARQTQNERLIGWIQLGMIVLFWTLYLIAPRPADGRTAMMAPVPMALLALVAITLVRLAIAYRGSLPEWLHVLSIVADTVLLLGLIWAFHLQYGQPAAFSLKVPTFAYLFVLIALRALHANPHHVLAAGLSAAIGWAVLTFLAVESSPPGTVTRDFVAYLTSNAILVGAELDKILALLVVTAVLALAADRAQETQRIAAREEVAARDLGRFLSRGVAQVVTLADNQVQAGMATQRDAAIIMLDIRGFTRLSIIMGPTEVVQVLSALHARIVPLIWQHGGVVDKFLGDGLMVTFGAVTPTATPEADAVRALDAVMDAAAAWRDELAASQGGVRLEVNGALTAGPVVFATVGTGERLEYTVIGEAVNLAAKLEKHNKVAGTRALVEDFAYRTALEQGYVPARPHDHLRGERLHGVSKAMDVVVLRA